MENVDVLRATPEVIVVLVRIFILNSQRNVLLCENSPSEKK